MADYLDKDGLDTLIENIKSKDDDLSSKIDDIEKSSLSGVKVNGTLANVTDRVADITVSSSEVYDGGRIYYGDCNVQAGSTKKSIRCTNLTELETGTAVIVTFAEENTADSPTLGKNDIGYYPIRDGSYYSASASHPFTWTPETSILFIFYNDGWDPVGVRNIQYGTSDTSSSVAAKCTNYITPFVLCIGSQITIKFEEANTASDPTLTIPGVAAYPIIGNTNWNAGDYVTFVFDGENYVGLSSNNNNNSSLDLTYKESTETLIFSGSAIMPE